MTLISLSILPLGPECLLQTCVSHPAFILLLVYLKISFYLCFSACTHMRLLRQKRRSLGPLGLEWAAWGVGNQTPEEQGCPYLPAEHLSSPVSFLWRDKVLSLYYFQLHFCLFVFETGLLCLALAGLIRLLPACAFWALGLKACAATTAWLKFSVLNEKDFLLKIDKAPNSLLFFQQLLQSLLLTWRKCKWNYSVQWHSRHA